MATEAKVEPYPYRIKGLEGSVQINQTNEQMSEKMNQLRIDEKFCDFEIRIKDKKFPAHKLVLSSTCSYFETLFQQECFIDNSTNFIQLDLSNPDIFEEILCYLYTGFIEIFYDNIENILSIAHFLQLTELVDCCAKYLSANLNLSNCIALLSISEYYSLNDLCFKAKRFIENNYSEIINEEDFVKIPATNLKCFLKSENLSITSEDQVLCSTIKWILHDPSEREKYIDQFLSIIRIPLIKDGYIDRLVEELNFAPLVDWFQNYRKLPVVVNDSAGITGYDSVRFKYRLGCRRLIFIFGGRSPVREKTFCCIDKYQCHFLSWQTLRVPLEIRRSGHSAVFLKSNDKIFIMGGCKWSGGRSPINYVEGFDPFKEEKFQVSPMILPRCYFGACAYGSRIYVFGGDISGTIIEQYDSIDDVWTLHDRLPFQLKKMQVIESNGLIYIIGGQDSCGYPTDLVHSYDPDTKKLTQLASLNLPRHSFAACLMHDRIYVIGGIGTNDDTPISSVEQFNIVENEWSFMQGMPIKKANHCAISLNNLIYVFGGTSQTKKMARNVYVFDPAENNWLTSSMPMSRGRLDAAAVLV